MSIKTMCSPEINISFLRYLYFMKWNNFLRITTVLVPASLLCFMDIYKGVSEQGAEEIIRS